MTRYIMLTVTRHGSFMSSSKPFIKTEKIGKRSWRVTEPFLRVPAGFISDGASVPRPLWWFLDPAGEAFEAAVVHDYRIPRDPSKYKIESHKEFRRILIAYNVKPWKAWIAFFVVCLYWLFKGFLTCRQN